MVDSPLSCYVGISNCWYVLLLTLFQSPWRTSKDSKAALEESVFLASDEEDRTEQVESLGLAKNCLSTCFSLFGICPLCLEWTWFSLAEWSIIPILHHHPTGFRNQQEDSECETMPASDNDMPEPEAPVLPPCPFGSVSVPQHPI